MGTTGAWNLPFPEDSDPPLGGSQLTALAEAADVGLVRASRYPNRPTCTAFTTAGQIANGANMSQPTLQLFVQAPYVTPNIFSLRSDSRAVMVARAGLYQVLGIFRFSNTGTAVDLGYIQVWAESPAGTSEVDSVTPTLNSATTDVFVNTMVSITAGAGVSFTLTNESGNAVNHAASKFAIIWATD